MEMRAKPGETSSARVPVAGTGTGAARAPLVSRSMRPMAMLRVVVVATGFCLSVCAMRSWAEEADMTANGEGRVHIVPPGGTPPWGSSDGGAGQTAVGPRICRWFRGKRAALSLRFDDSHPTHVEVAVPLLKEYGLIGTFLINPGEAEFGEERAAWESPAVLQAHELGNHTMNHQGARTDKEAEAEIGECADRIRQLQPERSSVLAFQPGGATLWLQRKPMEFFRQKYHLYEPTGSMSCSEDYEWFGFERFQERLDEAIAEGGWMQCHFHCIGEGHLGISEPLFRRLLEEARARSDEIWQDGIAAIYQYREERDGADVLAHGTGADTLTLSLACATDPEIYTHPLTLEVWLPAGCESGTVADAEGRPVEMWMEEAGDRRVLRFDVAPVDAAYTVRAAGLGAACRREVEVEMAAPGPHPYLFFNRADAPAILDKAGRAPASAMWERIKAQADELIGEDDDGAAGESMWDNRHRLRNLAFVYALTGEPAYATRAMPELEAILARDEWLMPKAEALETAEAICTLSIAYDWLYDALDEAKRSRIREAIVRDGIEPILRATEEGEWWTYWYRCNWGAVIYGQAGVAALSLLPDEPRAADWVRLCQQKVWHYTRSLGNDGGWGESGSYGVYGWTHAITFMDAIRHVSGGRVDLFSTGNVGELSDWFAYLMEPSQLNFIPFANSDTGTRGAVPILYRLAGEYRNGQAQHLANRVADRVESTDVFAYLWCDPTVEPRPLTELPRTKVFGSLDWAMLRNGWEDPEGVLFAFKGGQKDWDHQHHDLNSFVLYAYGEPLIIDLQYPHEVWGCRTEAHNTIMVEGKDQRGEVEVAGARGRPEHRSVIGGLVDVPWYTRFVGDASLGYEPEDVNSFVREVMYLRRSGESDPPDYFILFDEVDATKSSRIDWLLHTYGQVKVDRDRITIVQGKAAVEVTVIAPETFRYERAAKDLEEVGARSPFDSAQTVTTFKLWGAEPVQRGRFLSVIAPRPLARKEIRKVRAIRERNVLGAVVCQEGIEDVALFALEEPEADAAGVAFVGRSGMVRRAGGRVVKAALHDGQRLSANGVLLFETNSCGQAALSFDEEKVEAQLDLYDSSMVRIRAPRRPAEVLVNGDACAFEYEAELECVRIDSAEVREVSLLFR